MVESFEHRTQDAIQLIETSWRIFAGEMRYIHHPLLAKSCLSRLILSRGLRAKTLESNESSFIVEEMLPAYRAAASIEGKYYLGIKPGFKSHEYEMITQYRPRQSQSST
jgi:hypothetical protein